MDTASADLCPGCFAAPARAGPCPGCGFDANAPRPANALPLGTLLHGQDLVGCALGNPGGCGGAYLAMDYCRGLSLAAYLDQQPDGRLPEPQAMAPMQSILDGLRAVHAKSLRHRDITPRNIYLAAIESGNARPILLDWLLPTSYRP